MARHGSTVKVHILGKEQWQVIQDEVGEILSGTPVSRRSHQGYEQQTRLHLGAVNLLEQDERLRRPLRRRSL